MSSDDLAQTILDELLDRVLRGETVDIDRVLDEHGALSNAERSRIRRAAANLLGIPSSEPMENALPHIDLGGYRLLRELGGGGMGIVYLAEDLNLGRKAALKIIHPRLALTETHSKRFKREARAIATLSHPNIVGLYGAGEEKGVAFLAMEYIDGEGLDRVLKEHRERGESLPIKETVRIGLSVARALECAHQKGIVHRDVKPSNVLISKDGTPRLLDFGLARGGDLLSVSIDDRFRGTPYYASPEQVSPDRGEIDARTDIYSLGVTLYECVTNEVPFRGETTHHVFHQILVHEPKWPSGENQTASSELKTIILTAMEKDPKRRYASASDLASDLEALLDMRPISVSPPTPLRRLTKWTKRRPALALLSLMGLLLLLGGPVLFAVIQQKIAVKIRAERDEASRQKGLAEKSLLEITRLSDVVVVRELVQKAESLWPCREHKVDLMKQWTRDASSLLSRRGRHEETFGTLDGSSESLTSLAETRWRHETTQSLLRQLDDLSKLQSDIARRMGVAESIREATIVDYEDEWQDVRGEIFDHPLYGDLELSAQVGLVPLGFDSHSNLAEFWVYESGELPIINEEKGAYEILPETGMILVLIPGGTFRMGATRSGGPNESNLDPQSTGNESPPHDVELDPYFISKYEMTQGQWTRLAGNNPSVYEPGTRDGENVISLSHPVEGIQWSVSESMLQRWELRLPSEAQWERASRGGLSESRWMGSSRSAIQGNLNIADLSCKSRGGSPNWTYEEWLDDGYCMHAPVDAFRPNPFGLYNVLGNVAEWCGDDFGSYRLPVENGTGSRMVVSGETEVDRVFRGGNYILPLSEARVSSRYVERSDHRSEHIGIRPVRTPEVH